MRFVILFFILMLAVVSVHAQSPVPQIVEAKQMRTHYYFKILLNPGAPDGSVEGEEDERRYREFQWGLDQRERGPTPFAKIKKEMRLIVAEEKRKQEQAARQGGVKLPNQIGNL